MRESDCRNGFPFSGSGRRDRCHDDKLPIGFIRSPFTGDEAIQRGQVEFGDVLTEGNDVVFAEAEFVRSNLFNRDRFVLLGNQNIRFHISRQLTQEQEIQPNKY
ncbi:MAG: hypothetical protein RBG13Loki_0099 [Promethearchaeota archaeon CR_4]|nr:MAG: hypothetical protein RBG13Loki_0099 [Candidatus Lokiarchaeota archaeon CR_4]